MEGPVRPVSTNVTTVARTPAGASPVFVPGDRRGAPAYLRVSASRTFSGAYPA